MLTKGIVSMWILFVVILQVGWCVNSEVEEGLCTMVPTECSNSLQRKGICCKSPVSGELVYFRNFCLACLSVQIS